MPIKQKVDIKVFIEMATKAFGLTTSGAEKQHCVHIYNYINQYNISYLFIYT